jgi:ATP-dependent RNA helicase DDX51/DBP6
MRLARLLSLLDPSLRVGAFTGSSRQSDRRKALQSFRRGELRILIASNLASRSLNLDGLDHVINYDVPTSVEMYVHRVGRTARAGRAGVATTLLARQEARWFWKEIERSALIQRQDTIQRDPAPPITDEDRALYEETLQQLGEEARAQ